MPSGKTHFAIEATAGIALGAVLSMPPVRDNLPEALVAPAMLIAFFSGYIFSMFLISPDLDLANSSARKRWGPIGFLWIPYDIIFKHRGASHHLILGTGTRLLYLSCVLFLPATWFAWYMGWIAPELTQPTDVLPLLPLAAAFIIGAYLPDVLHVVADRVL